jgi:hypothetical protein
MSTPPRITHWENCLICGHLLRKHNFYEATMTTVPCPDGTCRDGG